jgi:hypothetical protein
MSQEQLKVVTNALQLFDIHEQTQDNNRRFQGTMHWKRIGGREYLYRGYSGGKTKSLGPRTGDTETLKKHYESTRAEHLQRKKQLREQLKIHAGYIRVNKLNRFPLTGANIVRSLQKHNIPMRVIGTNALYAYEVSAGILFLPELLSTDDLDFLMDSRQSIQIASALKKRTLLSILRDVDASFARLSDSPYEFAAANNTGYRIDFITQENKDLMHPNEFIKHLQAEDIKPQGIGSLKWLVASPKYGETVFDQRGNPLKIATVDPRAFVIHKFFIGQQEGRKPIKRKKDLSHARAVAKLLENELSHLPPSPAISRLFPREVVEKSPLKKDETL